MATKWIVTHGLGSFGTPSEIITDGLSSGAPAPSDAFGWFRRHIFTPESELAPPFRLFRWHNGLEAAGIPYVDCLDWHRRAAAEPEPEPPPAAARSAWHPGLFPAEPTGPDLLPWLRHRAPAPDAETLPVSLRRHWLPGLFSAEPTGADALGWLRRRVPAETQPPSPVTTRHGWHPGLVPPLVPDALAWCRRPPLTAEEPAAPPAARAHWLTTESPAEPTGPDLLSWFARRGQRFAEDAPAALLAGQQRRWHPGLSVVAPAVDALAWRRARPTDAPLPEDAAGPFQRWHPRLQPPVVPAPTVDALAWRRTFRAFPAEEAIADVSVRRSNGPTAWFVPVDLLAWLQRRLWPDVAADDAAAPAESGRACSRAGWLTAAPAVVDTLAWRRRRVSAWQEEEDAADVVAAAAGRRFGLWAPGSATVGGPYRVVAVQLCVPGAVAGQMG